MKAIGQVNKLIYPMAFVCCILFRQDVNWKSINKSVHFHQEE